jgi:hypothetical protein
VTDTTGSWQPDPHGRHQYRYWDGTSWTDQVADDGVTAVDPPDPGGAPPPSEGSADAPADTPADATPGEPTPPAPADPTTTSSWGAPPTDPGATTSMPLGAPVGDPAAPADAPKKGSGNKPALIIGGILLLALLGAGAWLIFGGSDDDDLRDELIADMMDEGASREEAECVVDALGDEIGYDRMRELDNDDSEMSAEEMSAVLEAVTSCGADLFGLGEETTDTTTDDDDTTDTTEGIGGNQALMDLFIQGVMQGSDLSEEQARCFSEEFLQNSGVDLAELMENPDDIASDPDVMRSMIDIFETCDIDPSAMGGTSGGGTSSDADDYGDDPELDALWDACEGGDGEACDDLYFQSPIGSRYEDYGNTCGDRFPDGGQLCATSDLG